MFYIYQDCKHSCALACLASIAELELSVVKEIAEREGFSLTTGMGIEREEHLSLDLGLRLDYPDDDIVHRDPSVLDIGNTYIISVPSLNRINGRHRVIIKRVREGVYKYHDPARLMGNYYGESGAESFAFPYWFRGITKVNF